VVDTYPDVAEPTNDDDEEDYLESEDPTEMGVESHQYDLDAEGGESMAYEGDPNNPGRNPIAFGPGDYRCPYCSKKASTIDCRTRQIWST
jgi:hypothetical protein